MDPLAAQVARRVARIAAGATRIHRCVGTEAEAQGYLGGERAEPGWRILGHARAGDLLLGVTGRGSRYRVVSVTRVVEVGRGRTYWWEAATDARIAPGVVWSEVEARLTGKVPRSWSTLEGAKAADLLDAVVAAITAQQIVPESEGDRQVQSCRRRSRRNRAEALRRAGGVCQGCRTNYRHFFGGYGDRALDAHHQIPLSQTPGIVQTSVEDLTVLCAACHRLLHVDPDLDLRRLQDGWAGLA